MSTYTDQVQERLDRLERLEPAFEAMRGALRQAAIVIRGIPFEKRVSVPGIAKIVRAALALADKVSR